MKHHAFLLLTALFLAVPALSWGQKGSKTEVATIHTSAVCDQCMGFIEEALGKLKGVKSAKVYLESKTVEVTFRPSKTNLDALRKAISKAGYEADEVPADQEAYDNLPKCCRKGGHH